MNIARLYERQNPHAPFRKYCGKCGAPPFTAYVVKDRAPDYKYVQTTSGNVSFCNANFIKAKKRFREGLPHPHLIHSSTGQLEYVSQISLLFGGMAAFEKAIEYGDEIVLKDLIGSKGWDSWHELFEVLADASAFALLDHSLETLATASRLEILTEDFDNIAALLNLKQRKDRPHRGTITVAGHPIEIVGRFIGDNSFPERWQLDMLSRRKQQTGKSFVLSDHDQYFSILYRCLTRDGALGTKYAARLRALQNDLNMTWDVVTMEQGDQEDLLRGFLRKNLYFSSLPIDPRQEINEPILKSMPRRNSLLKLRWPHKIKVAIRRLRFFRRLH